MVGSLAWWESGLDSRPILTPQPSVPPLLLRAPSTRLSQMFQDFKFHIIPSLLPALRLLSPSSIPIQPGDSYRILKSTVFAFFFIPMTTTLLRIKWSLLNRVSPYWSWSPSLQSFATPVHLLNCWQFKDICIYVFYIYVYIFPPTPQIFSESLVVKSRTYGFELQDLRLSSGNILHVSSYASDFNISKPSFSHIKEV